MVNTNSQDYKDGYQAAIEAIKQQMQNGGGAGDVDDGSAGGADDGSAGGGAAGDENQGVVQPDDCADVTGELADCPGTPGAFIDKATGDKIAESEGYSKEGGGQSAIEKTWEEAGKQVANKLHRGAGNAPGYSQFIEKLNNLYKSKVNWKAALRKVVGRSLSPESKRRGYTHKNLLATQNMFFMTDLQKFDNMDYLIVALDMSGSFMGDKEFVNQALTEVATVAEAKKPMKIVVMQWDTRVADVQMFDNVRDLKKALSGGFIMKGGGGTNPECIWQFLKTDKRFKKSTPELLMIFTDGEFSEQPKRNRSLMQWLCWVVIDNPGKELPKDAMTTTIHISMKDVK